ncbi:MAG: hypothetical protein Q4Q28_08545 [Bacteroidales bacterium]|nr:hypothetical protein [Bacteroidales bacterium]
MKYPYYILFSLLLLLTSCSEERDVRNSVQRLDITFADTQSRSNWSDLTDTEDKKVVYVWKNDGNNMLTAIKHGSEYVPFFESMTSAGEYYTKTKFETVDAAKSKITLHTVNGVKLNVADGNYVYPVAAGDAMHCFHPINSNTTVSSSADAVTVDMKLPSTFHNNQLQNDLKPLAEYSYVYTSTTLQSVDANKVVAKTSHFNSACAIIRFNVTNSVTSDIIITGIKMESDDGSKIFPNVLRFADGKVAEQADKASYYSRLSTVIESATIPRSNTGTFYSMCFPLDEGTDFNGVPLKFTIDTNYLTYQLRLNSRVITNNKFEAGKIYTFNFTLEEKEIRLNTIDISLCTTYNIDSAESLHIIVSPDAIWDQTGNESAQMVFVSLGMSATIDGKDYEVLWATCNLGAMEPIETGFHYAWGEVERKGASKYSPAEYVGTATTDIMGTEHDAVKAYLGGGYWLWCMPTKEMWQDIISNCTWTWKTVKKAADGNESEDNLNFDASVWEVTKRDNEGKLVGLIYLPITGYSGYDSTTDTYKKINKARCHYWTSTPCSSTAGGEAESWAFETTYYTEEGTGNGHMTDPTLVANQRYNGYCIRPVLLKKKN